VPRRKPFPRVRFGITADATREDLLKGAESAWYLQEWFLYLCGEREKVRPSAEFVALMGEKRLGDLRQQAQRLVRLARETAK
jgi:hypothetical protein